MSVQVFQPFEIFYDINGKPVDDGFIWIGQPNLDPETNQISVFFDEALTIPATQPIRTRNGFPSNAGAQAQIFVGQTPFSITIKNKNSTIIRSVASVHSSTDLEERLADPDIGAELVGYQYSADTEPDTLDRKSRERISVLDFMTQAQRDDALSGAPVLDHSAALAEAWGSGLPVKGDGRALFRIASSSNLINKTVDFDGEGCRFQLVGDVNLIEARNDYLSLTNVTVLNNAATADLSGGTVATPTDVAILTVASAAGYAQGSIVKIISDDLMPGENPADLKRSAEYAVVAIVSGNDITLYNRLNLNYVSNVRVARINEANTFEFNNFEVLGQVSPDPTWSTPTLTAIGYNNPKVHNPQFSNLVERAMRFVGCFKPETTYARAKNVRTSLADDAFGYVIHEVACHGGFHLRPQGINVRHIYACSAVGLASLSADVPSYGQNRSAVVMGGYGRNCQAAAFEAHADGEDISFIGCVSEQTFNGPIGAFMGFGFRGRGNRAIGCTSIGSGGFRAFSDFASPDNSRDHEFIDCRYVFNPNQTLDHRAFYVLGLAGGEVHGIRVSSPNVLQSGGSLPSFEAERGSMRVENPKVKASQTGASVGRVFEANVDGSIRCKGGSIDYSDATGTGLRTARVTSNTGSITLEGLDITSVAGLAVLGDLVNTNGTFICRHIDMTAAPSTASGLTGLGGTPIAWVDYRVNDGRTSTRATLGVTAGVAGSTSVDLSNRAADHIFLNFSANIAGVELNVLTAGYAVGQLLIIRSSGTNSFVLKHNVGGLINITTDETINVGKSYNLRWDGAAWVSA